MKTDDGFDRWLANRLRQESEDINDAGFTAGVIAALPAPGRLSIYWQVLLYWLPVIGVSALVLNLLPLTVWLQELVEWSLELNLVRLVQAGLMVTLALGACAALLLLRELDPANR